MNTYDPTARSATPSEQLAAQQRMCEAALRNPVAEHQLLACLLARPTLIDDARSSVPPYYIIHDGSRVLYEIILDHAALARANGWACS